MRLRLRWMVASSLAVAWGSAGAYVIRTEYDHLSAFKDVSNLWESSSDYYVDVSHYSWDAPLFINSVSIVTGGGWDPNLDLNTTPGGLYYNGGSSFYTFGTEIDGDQYFNFRDVAYRSGAVDSRVAPGLYGFQIDFTGGADANATDNLATLDCVLAVGNKLDVAVTGDTSPTSIGAGQQTTVFMTVKNNMASDNFVSTTWFYSGGGVVKGSAHLTCDGFTGNWFDKVLAPGDSRTDEHSRWHADASNPLGTYTAHVGIVGGLYDGDDHYIEINPAPTVEVTAVPEPTTLAALALGAVLLLRGRARQRR